MLGADGGADISCHGQGAACAARPRDLGAYPPNITPSNLSWNTLKRFKDFEVEATAPPTFKDFSLETFEGISP